MRTKIFNNVILVILSIFIFSSNVFLWDNEKTHRDLSNSAADSSILSDAKGNYLKNLGFNKGVEETFKWRGITKSAKMWLQDGSEVEDSGPRPDYRSLSLKARFNNHFHDPTKGWGKAGLNDSVTIIVPSIPPYIIRSNSSGESALKWAQDKENQQSYSESDGLEGDQTWQKTRNHYYVALTSTKDIDRKTEFAQTFKGLGHQIHLIQDMAVPAHVRNDAHPLDNILGINEITGDLYFETYAKLSPDVINNFATNPIYPQVDLTTNPAGKFPVAQHDKKRGLT